jgi:hypothetical protein
VAAGVASACESDRSALKAAIAIVRFFSIQKSPIRQTDNRLVQLNARNSGAAIAPQTSPRLRGSWPHSLVAAGAKSIPNRAPKVTANSMDRGSASAAVFHRGSRVSRGRSRFAPSRPGCSHGLFGVTCARGNLGTARASRGSCRPDDISHQDEF